MNKQGMREKKEIWKDVVGWRGLYKVSDFGRVMRIKRAIDASEGRILKPWKNTGKYPCVDLCDSGRRKCVPIHCLVAAAFIGPRENKLEVNHKDGNKNNGNLDNLEYVTRQENMLHAKKLGLFRRGDRKKKEKKSTRGEKNHKSILTEQKVIRIRKLLKGGQLSAECIGILHGVSSSTIMSIKSGRSWGWLK